VSSHAVRRIDALIGVGLRLARSARSGRVLLARAYEAIDLLWVPRPWGDELVAELEAAHSIAHEPLSMRTVERSLRDAWGVNPADQLDELDPEPVAVTPSAQVHRGVLDGDAVAVKVLRPGLAGSVRQDLVLLEGLLAPLRAAFPALDASALLEEFRDRVLEELDLESEATAQRQFHRRLRGHAFLAVPAPVTRLATGGVLVTEWVDGVPFREAPDPDRAAAQLVAFVLGAGRAGLAHADPNLEDALGLEDGRLALVDFGATRVVLADRFDAAADALEAFIAGDAGSLGAALERLGWLSADRGEAVLELGREILRELAEPGKVRLDSDAVLQARDRMLDRLDDVLELMFAGRLAPEDLWPLRGAAQLFGTIARVGATGAWGELALRAMREGWSGEAG
jgi:predicted unusual protein kinase regulating ubiquinone biosynthesis (AarF/ABC1/UbiB family)